MTDNTCFMFIYRQCGACKYMYELVPVVSWCPSLLVYIAYIHVYIERVFYTFTPGARENIFVDVCITGYNV